MPLYIHSKRKIELRWVPGTCPRSWEIIWKQNRHGAYILTGTHVINRQKEESKGDTEPEGVLWERRGVFIEKQKEKWGIGMQDFLAVWRQGALEERSLTGKRSCIRDLNGNYSQITIWPRNHLTCAQNPRKASNGGSGNSKEQLNQKLKDDDKDPKGKDWMCPNIWTWG